MRKTLQATVLIASILVLAQAVWATVTFVPAQPNVDQTVAFSLTGTNINQATIVWNFGDGTQAYGVFSPTKVYAAAGTFRVTVDYLPLSFAGAPISVHEEVQVPVLERRRISFVPSNPGVLQPVSFTAQNFLSGSIRWDFGDGTPAVLGGAVVSHAFALPQSYVVRARDLGGASLAVITATVPVAADISRRRITLSPTYPALNRPVTFTAVNFFTSAIRWDFGDGTPPVSGGLSANHAFARAGQFRVRAWDWDGAYGGPTEILVQVLEDRGPRAAFQLFFLQLRFDDGLGYKVVLKDTPDLLAFADIKYEGTGMFEAQWLVDGAPFRLVTRAMPFAGALILDSGSLPGLPTALPGIHEVSLRILRPTIDFTVPVIRYFVSAEKFPPERERLRLRVESAEGLLGASCVMALDRVRIPNGAHFILHGTVKNETAAPVRIGLFRVHVAGTLVDQQYVRDLGPGEERAFTTSILNASPEGKRVYITVYDISDPGVPRLLLLKRLDILADDP